MKTLAHLHSSALLTSLLLVSAPAHAQTGNNQDDAADIVVTGSRLSGTAGLTSSSPIQAISAAALESTGTVNPEQLLNSYPQLVPGLTGFSNNGAGILGAATLNSRNLGAVRTLVLVDSRRFTPYQQDGTVDINTIPSALIERVEVLTGGASAVYGSDAVTGVINFILKKDFQGFDVSGSAGISGKGDAPRYSFDAIVGTNFADGKGNITLYGGYLNRGHLYSCDRAVSCTSLTDSGTSLIPFLSNTSNGVIIPNFTGNPFGTGSAGTAFGPGGSFHAVTNADKFELNANNYMLTPEERINVAVNASYEIAPGITPFANISFTDSTVTSLNGAANGANIVNAVLQVRSPYFSAATQSALANLDASQRGVVGNVQQVANDGYVTIPTIARRLSENSPRGDGTRYTAYKRRSYNIATGFRGETDGWKYEVSYMTANSSFTTSVPDASRSRFLQTLFTEFDSNGVLRCVDPAARAQGCVPGNVFAPGQLSPEAVKYISHTANNHGEIARRDFSAFVSHDLFDLGAGAGNALVGIGHRYDSAHIQPDEAVQRGDTFASQSTATVGSIAAKEFFTEVRQPLIADKPFINMLTVTGAARYSRYDIGSIGGVWTYAGGLQYRPVKDLLLRVNYQSAIRAPNVSDLFSGLVSSVTNFTDPCSDKTPAASRTTTLRQICEANGVPSALVFTGSVQPNASGFVASGGNSNLRPEKAKTITFGGVFTPSFLPGFNVSADYYDIRISDVIGPAGGGATGVLNLCYNVLQDPNSAYCSYIERTGSGIIRTINARADNLGELKRSGIDFQIGYRTNLPFGFDGNSRLSLNFNGGYVIKSVKTPVAAQPDIKVYCLGAFGNLVCGEPDPRFKSFANLDWSSSQLNIGIHWRHLSGIRDDRINSSTTKRDPNTLAVPFIGAYDYFDLSIGYDLPKIAGGSKLTLSVNNVFNKQPPQLGTSGAISSNTWASTYDVIGRYFTLTAKTKF